MLLFVYLPLLFTLADELLPNGLPKSFAWPPLVTAATPPSSPDFTPVAWWRGEYQSGIDAWFTDRMEPRVLIVRIVNQAYYSLFAKSQARDIRMLIGRNGTLYPILYLRAYCRSALAPRIAQTWIDRFADLRERLARRGTSVLLLLTPSKAVSVPDDLPGGLCDPPNPPDAPRRDFVAMAAAARLPLVDGAALVHEMSRDPVPAFPRYGAHWNRLALARVSAATMAAIGAEAGTDLGGIAVGPPRWDVASSARDGELAAILNLLSGDFREQTADASIDCAPTEAGRARALVAVGMSFLEQVLDNISGCELFGSIRSYFYYTIWRRDLPGNEQQRVDRAALDWNSVFSKPSVLIVEFNEARLDDELDWLDAFLDDALAEIR